MHTAICREASPAVLVLLFTGQEANGLQCPEARFDQQSSLYRTGSRNVHQFRYETSI